MREFTFKAEGWSGETRFKCNGEVSVEDGRNPTDAAAAVVRQQFGSLAEFSRITVKDVTDAVFGYEVQVECCDLMVYIPGSDRNTIVRRHYIGSKRNAERNAMIAVPRARKVIAAHPLTKREWIDTFGLGRS